MNERGDNRSTGDSLLSITSNHTFITTATAAAAATTTTTTIP